MPVRIGVGDEDMDVEVREGALSGSTGPRWDMGPVADFDAKPPGCQGKIDFLFIISRDGHMKPHQDKLVAAFPHFIETIAPRSRPSSSSWSRCSSSWGAESTQAS